MKPISLPKVSSLRGRAVQQIRRALDGVMNWPAITWVLLAFFVVFFAYFIGSTYLNAYHELRLFTDFPYLQPLGADLHEYLGFSKALFDTGNPYIPPNYYPPFEAVFFLRLMHSGPDQGFVYITVLSFLSLIGIAFLYPVLVSKDRRMSTLGVFGLVTGFFSFGLWFEIERGQFDLLVMAMCFAGLYLYHYHPRWRIVAYLLFIMSVQVKLYTGIFLFCFTTDWRAWKVNLLRWGGLLLANFAGLFILGVPVFMSFINALTSQVNKPTYWGTHNHSADSFVRTLVDSFKSQPALYAQLKPDIRLFELPLMAFYVICLAAIFWISYKKRLSAINPYLLVVLTIGTMVLPSTSHDYKLSIFIGPVVALLNSFELRRSGRGWLDAAAIGLLLLLSAAYGSTLFMHDNDMPVALANNLPALLIISLCCVLLLLVRLAQSKRLEPEAEFRDLN
jgi:hypothetical protein